MDYINATDYQINCLVGEKLGFIVVTSKGDAGHCVGLARPGEGMFTYFDYCNNVKHAWPIIVENKINVEWHEWKDDSFKPYALNNATMKSCYDKNPLRAAMIVFLEMQNEQV